MVYMRIRLIRVRWGRELVALLNLSSWYLVMVEWLFLAVPWGCLRFVIVVFPDHAHLLFLRRLILRYIYRCMYLKLFKIKKASYN